MNTNSKLTRKQRDDLAKLDSEFATRTNVFARQRIDVNKTRDGEVHKAIRRMTDASRPIAKQFEGVLAKLHKDREVAILRLNKEHDDLLTKTHVEKSKLLSNIEQECTQLADALKKRFDEELASIDEAEELAREAYMERKQEIENVGKPKEQAPAPVAVAPEPAPAPEAPKPAPASA
jgi:hypothetical protein